MPRTSLTVNRLSDVGTADPAPVAGDTVNGNAMPNTGKTILRVTNTDGAASHQLTLGTPITVGGKAVADTMENIPAGATYWYGGLPTSLYGTSTPIDVDDAQLELTVFEP